MRQVAQILALILGLFAAHGSFAADAKDGSWRFLEPDDPLYLSERGTLYGVGMRDRNGHMARIYLVPDRTGAIASITLPAQRASGPVISTLHVGKSSLFSRQIAGDQMLVSRAGADGPVTVNFAISAADVDLFMAARVWELRLGEARYVLPLTGSRAALELARQRMGEDAPPIAEGSN